MGEARQSARHVVSRRDFIVAFLFPFGGVEEVDSDQRQ